MSFQTCSFEASAKKDVLIINAIINFIRMLGKNYYNLPA
jgi:hypothetical protein